MVGLSSDHWPLFFTAKDVSLLRGKVYDACVQSCVLHGNETWSLKKEKELPLHQIEMRRIKCMCGVNLMDKLPCVELTQQLEKEDLVKLVQRITLHCYRHVLTLEW